jgi:hypothetical protein
MSGFDPKSHGNLHEALHSKALAQLAAKYATRDDDLKIRWETIVRPTLRQKYRS